jgi:hypothetical protein
VGGGKGTGDMFGRKMNCKKAGKVSPSRSQSTLLEMHGMYREKLIDEPDTFEIQMLGIYWKSLSFIRA